MSVVAREVIPQESAQSTDSRALMSLIERLASSPEIDLNRIEKMLELKERWEAAEARKAYFAAMASFKENPPEILKDKHVKYTTTKGTTEYDHATLGAACTAIIKGLSAVGISHRWDLAQNENRIKVTCILTHAQGHSESVSLHSGPDDSGGKNSIQAIQSAITYLERSTLFAASGLAPLDMEDDDGRGAGGAPANGNGGNKPEAPKGYADWRKSIEATAAKGTVALQAAWKDAWKNSNGFCGYAGTTDLVWWNEQKVKAEKATKAHGAVR